LLYASNMILCVVPDAAYLVLPNACSRCASLYYLSNLSNTNPPKPKPNRPVHVLCKTMGHKQPSKGTPLETDNSTAHDILKAQVRMK
jgi:hypothetical protein